MERATLPEMHAQTLSHTLNTLYNKCLLKPRAFALCPLLLVSTTNI